MARGKRVKDAQEQLAEVERRIMANRTEYAALKKAKKELSEIVKQEDNAELLAEIRRSGLPKEEIIRRIREEG